MRVGVVTTSYPRYQGDPAGQFVAGLNRYLVRCGHTVEVLAAAGEAGSGPATVDEPFEPGVSVLRVPSPLFYRGGAPEVLFAGRQRLGERFPAVEALRYSAACARLLWSRQPRYDAVISHWLVPCGLLGALLVPGRQHVAIAHSSDVHLLRRWRLTGVARYIASRARIVYTCSSLRLPGAPGVVVPMGIDAAAFWADDEARQAARQRLGSTAKTLLFLGRLVPVKGVELLLAALVCQPALHLWIAGDGPLRRELEQKVEALGLGQRVRLFGEVAGRLRQELLLACDVLALPSLRLGDGRTDGAPQVVLEGLAAGCALVASSVGGVAELLGEAGWLVPPGDALALGAALFAAATLGEGERSALRLRARERARSFDWSLIAPQILGPRFSSPRER